MATIDIKSEVARAVRGEWPAFASAHPKLAAVLDETVLIDGAITSLADDPEYQEAMATAEAVGAGGEIVSSLIHRLVIEWLRRLI